MQPKKYLSLLFVSRPTLAANARGEGHGGNAQSLQMVSTGMGSYTVASGYALRRAMRNGMQDSGADLWRQQDASDSPSGYGYGPSRVPAMADALPTHQYEYDDLGPFGLMVAGSKAQMKLRSQLQVSPALSATPYRGDVGYALGHKAEAKKTESIDLCPFTYERHHTRYLFTMTFNLTDWMKQRPGSVKHVLDTLRGLQVGGNHAANHSALVPEALVWRFYNTAGQSGLFLSPHQTREWTSDKPIDLKPLLDQSRDLGFDFEYGGLSVSDRPISDCLDRIWQQVQEYTA